MATTVNLRKILDRKQWEMMTPAPAATVTGAFTVSSGLQNQLQLFMQASTVHYLYRPDEDAWITLPAGTLGTLAAGSCGTHHPMGPTGTATAGSSTTLTTNLTIPGSLAGYVVRITGGTGAGQERTITSNTTGANSVLTTSAWSITPDNTSVYVIMSGRFYCLGASGAALTLKYYDVATNTWSSSLNVTGPPAAFGTEGRLIATNGGNFATGTATAGAASTLTNSGKAWATNQWANYQIRLTGGTGAGQVRTIASNTGTVITVSANWTANPDATSTYVIEGNDDFIYLMGHAAVTMYRYSISGNSWTTLSPGVARAAAPGAGMTGHWVASATASDWTPENAIKNGRYLFSFRGAATADLHVYDIAANSWATVVYQRQAETFTTGSSAALIGSVLYIQKDATGRFFKYDCATATMDPWSTLLYPQSTAVAGDKTFDAFYTDGGTTMRWVYNLRNSGTELFRCLVI